MHNSEVWVCLLLSGHRKSAKLLDDAADVWEPGDLNANPTICLKICMSAQNRSATSSSRQTQQPFACGHRWFHSIISKLLVVQALELQGVESSWLAWSDHFCLHLSISRLLAKRFLVDIAW